MTQDAMRAIQRETGVPSRLVETVFYQVDTIDALTAPDWLVFKGGTCVQSHLRHDRQRASVDLDFNTTAGNPNAVMDLVERLNGRLRGEGRTTVQQGVEFGTIEYIGTDERSGTLNFLRRMPSRLGEFERAGKDLIQSKNLRLQMNYKHAWLPCLEGMMKEFDPFIFEHQAPVSPARMTHSSPEDLMADKILTTSLIGTFGRERYKDVYDLYQLHRIVKDAAKVLKKLDMVSRRAGLTTQAILDASIETVSRFSTHSLEARGFLSMVCRGGRKDMEDWEGACRTVGETLEGLRAVE